MLSHITHNQFIIHIHKIIKYKKVFQHKALLIEVINPWFIGTDYKTNYIIWHIAVAERLQGRY